MSWVYLIAAGAFEVGWVAALKASAGLTRCAYSALALVLLITSLAFLGMATRAIPVSVAYPVWVGVGAVGAVLLEAAQAGSFPSALRLGAILLVLAGIIGIKVSQ